MSAHDGRNAHEALDEIAGMNMRVAWLVSGTDGFITSIESVTGPLLEPAKRERREAPLPRHIAFLTANYSFLPSPCAQHREARDAVCKHLTRQWNGDPDEVLANEQLFFFPSDTIGLSGILVERSTGVVIPLGSAVPHGAHVWAYYRGFANAETAGTGRNDLRVLSVADIPETDRVLRPIVGPREYEATFKRTIHSRLLPAIIRGVNLYFHRYFLWEAEVNGWFQFDVLPLGAEAA